jgi:DNA-binding NarL/FixJ family response regulator
MKEMRILIADDHPIFRHGLVRAVEGTPGLAVVGEAGNGKEALALLKSLKPDIVVLDISMPEMDGLQVMRSARKDSYEGAFVVLTMYREEEYFNEALDLGALGYLLKESATSDLLHCLRTVAEGKHYVSPEMSDHLVVRTAKRDRLNRAIPSIASLSGMERRILRLLADNRTSREIAREIGISYRTVQNHRAHICEKLGLEGHNKLLQFALEHRSLL